MHNIWTYVQNFNVSSRIAPLKEIFHWTKFIIEDEGIRSMSTWDHPFVKVFPVHLLIKAAEIKTVGFSWQLIYLPTQGKRIIFLPKRQGNLVTSRVLS